MERRKFLNSIIAGGVVLKFFPEIIHSQTLPDLAVVQSESPYIGTKKAIEKIGGIKKFISRGDKVIVKPNIGWDRIPEQGANTNPEVVKALVEMAYEAGAKKVIVLDNACDDAKKAYIRSGIEKAAKEAGAEVPLPNLRRIKRVKINGEYLKEWDVLVNFLEVDKIINVPVAKHHSLAVLTLGMKNWLGAIGGERNRLHQQIDGVVNDLADFFKPSLSVIDAWRIMVRNGPTGGSLSDVQIKKTIIAGKDYVAVDSYGATLFGKTYRELGFLRIAEKRKNGEVDLSKLRIEQTKI